MKKIYKSHSFYETEKIGEEIAKTLKPFSCLALKGGMGMGKTCFVRGLAKGLGFLGEVSSPTFAIVNEYRGGKLDLFHFDMYRINSWDELYSIGFFDYMEEGAVLAIEWSENIEAALPQDTITVTIEKTSENSRTITLKGASL